MGTYIFFLLGVDLRFNFFSWTSTGDLFEFSLNVFTEFSEFSDKNIFHYNKRAWTCKLLCKRPGCYHSTSKTHVKDRIFKLSPKFILQWFISFPEFTEFLFYLGKTPVSWQLILVGYKQDWHYTKQFRICLISLVTVTWKITRKR